MRTETKRKICAAVGWLALLLFFGTVGGMDCGTLPFGRGAAEAAALLIAAAALLRKAGVVRSEK